MLSLYKSSAGSGKTHTLVLEYLKIVLARPEIYRSILAVTFTNKATDEMKGRIISSLSDLSTQSDEALLKNPMFLGLQEYFSTTDQKLAPNFSIRKNARKALSLILNDYSNFSVSTIESFFQRILRAFARELNIPLGYDVETKNSLVLDQLVDGILMDVGKKEKLRKILESFVDRNLEEEKTWNLEGYIREVGSEIFKEKYQALDNEREKSDPEEENYIEKTLDLANKIRAIRKRFEGGMEELGRQGQELMQSHGLSVEDFSYGKSGVANHFFKVQDNKLSVSKKYEPTKRALSAREDIEAWIPKKSDKQEQLRACVQGGLLDVLDNMIMLFENEYATYNTALQASMSIYSFGLLTELKERLTAYRKENGQLIISDTGLLLQKVIKDPYHAPFIYEKVGTRFQHFLLDEFQDTSNMQWRNMMPLLAEALAYDNFSMLVGDAKQSIYRWRNGNMDLLLNKVEKDIKSIVNQDVTTENLDNNWRTAREIVEFNNWLFLSAADYLAKDREDPAFGQMMLAAYGGVTQHPKKEKYPGYVSVEFLEDLSKRRDDPGPKWEEQAERRCMELIWSLGNEGFEPHEITLLVRNNIHGTRLATYLQRESAREAKPIKVVSADSLLIASDPKVQFLYALLQYLNYESNEVNSAALSYYYNLVVEGEASHHAVFLKSDEEILPEFEKYKKELRRKSIYECIERLCNLFSPLLDANAYIQGFKDAALSYAAENDPGISSFLEWWETEKNSRAIASAASRDAVQIMTIHKSKGLEFPIVILPYAEWEMPPKARGYLWVNPQKAPYQSFEFFPMKLSGQLESSWFKEEYQQEEQSSYLDNLNLLYVSLTRPKYRLYLLSKAPSIDKRSGQPKMPTDFKSISKLLYRILKEDPLDGLKEDEDFHFSYGQLMGREEIRSIEGSKESSLGKSLEMKRNEESIPNWNDMLRIRFSSNQFLNTEIRKRDEVINRGELLHEGLAFIEEKGDLDKAVRKLVLRGMLKEEEFEKAKAELQQIISNDKVKHWFEGAYEVKNEAEIILSNGKVFRPDRVMIKQKKAILVDYKSGKPNRKYQSQMQEYMQAVLDLGYTEIEGYIYYILRGDLEKIPFNPQLGLQL
ncbi:MAG: UvrD-helicase domain-containing protein [Bacteroidia bacterium]|nr:UvrD-helicase domain-containing protein [Bacteroidia bacterium]